MFKKPFCLVLFFPLIAAGLMAIGLPKVKTAPKADREKLTAQEIVVKHLDSLGPAGVRSKITTRQIVGTCKFTAKLAAGGISTTDGPAVIASDGAKVLIAAAFNSPNYPKETLGYDGDKLTVGYIKPGLRTTLGDFLISNKVTFKEGLIGGSLSSAWPFWDLTDHDARLETGGMKKINGRDAYVIKYSPKKGSEFDIRIYFDAETFQHVRTEYDRVVSALNAENRIDSSRRQRELVGGVDGSARQREARYGMIEEFSDYKAEAGVMMAHSYRIEISLDGQQGTSVQEWLFSFNTFTFNEKIDQTAFNVETGVR
jgi:hypothetical protein